MRYIDADKLYPDCMTKNETLAISQSQIANAPTVDITEEQAIDKLHETGWMPRHDKEMTDRPKGHWIEEYTETGALGIKYTWIKCSECGWKGSLVIPRDFCPKCGAKMEDEGKKERDAYWDEAMKWHDKLDGGRE